MHSIIYSQVTGSIFHLAWLIRVQGFLLKSNWQIQTRSGKDRGLPELLRGTHSQGADESRHARNLE
jgi:hypothetical protein